MSVRNTKTINDIKHIMYSFFEKLRTTTAPWSSWTIRKEWPSDDWNRDEDRLIFWIESPQPVSDIQQMAGKDAKRNWSLWTGAWSNSIDEIDLASSEMLYRFESGAYYDLITFTVVLGGTTYSNKNLSDLGISVRGVVNVQDKDMGDKDEFATGFELSLIA